MIGSTRSRPRWGFLVLVLAAAAVTAASGCIAETQLVEQAAFDHQCPVSNVVVVERSGDPFSPSMRVDVCGSVRVYRDLNMTEGFMWVDVTDGAPAVPLIQPAPRQNTYYQDYQERQRRARIYAPPSHRSYTSPSRSYTSPYNRR